MTTSLLLIFFLVVAIDNFKKYYSALDSIYPLPKLCGTFSPMKAEVAKTTSQNMLINLFDFMFNNARENLDLSVSCLSNSETILSISSLMDIR